MTFHAYDDGPFSRSTEDGDWEDYFQRRWALRCNGEELLGDFYSSYECHVVSDGEWERTPAAALRQLARDEGWQTYRWGNRTVDLCPQCQKRLQRALVLAEAMA